MVRLAVLTSLLLAACDVGEIPVGGGDGGGSGGADGSGSGSGSNCEQLSASPPAGHHNPGMGCRSAAMCHNAALGLGVNAPEYSVGGTLYKDSAGTMPYAGATILVTFGGTTKKAIAADNGNFWFVPALLPSPTNAMTGMTSASGCPNTLAMGGALVNGGGDCNNCHRATGGTTSPIYLTP
jgi:hypothetical protein